MIKTIVIGIIVSILFIIGINIYPSSYNYFSEIKLGNKEFKKTISSYDNNHIVGLFLEIEYLTNICGEIKINVPDKYLVNKDLSLNNDNTFVNYKYSGEYYGMPISIEYEPDDCNQNNNGFLKYTIKYQTIKEGWHNGK